MKQALVIEVMAVEVSLTSRETTLTARGLGGLALLAIVCVDADEAGGIDRSCGCCRRRVAHGCWNFVLHLALWVFELSTRWNSVKECVEFIVLCFGCVSIARQLQARAILRFWNRTNKSPT